MTHWPASPGRMYRGSTHPFEALTGLAACCTPTSDAQRTGHCLRQHQFSAHRKVLQQAKQVRAVRTSQGKEQRWMRDTHHKLSRQIVTHAQEQEIGSIRLEALAG